MSDRLRDTVAEPGPGEDGRLVADVGGSTARNGKARPEISLLFPVRHADDYSFFVDGRATVESSGLPPRAGRCHFDHDRTAPLKSTAERRP